MNPTEPSTRETNRHALIRPVFAERYRELGEGVVCDLQTGLYWLRKPLGRVYQWAEALQAAEAFNRAGGAAGYQDWRLPHRGPLKTLLDRPQRPSAFPGARAGRYWTASPQDQPRYAWFVDFDTGQTGPLSKQARLQVRLMRNGRLEPALSDA